jgi:hypothetical protein
VAAHSLRECRRGMARWRGQVARPWVSGHTDACMHVGVGGRWTDFRPSRSGGGSVRAAAHGLRECLRAMARQRGQVARPWVSGHTDACMHVGVGGRWDRFSTVEKRRRECAGCRARSARVPGSDGATARAGCQTSIFRPPWSLHAYWRGRSMGPIFDHRETGTAVLARAGALHGLGEWPRAIARRGRAFTGPQDFGPLGRCTHIGVGTRRDRFSTIDERGRRCLREPAHGLRAWPRAIARRGRAFTGPQDFGPLGRCTHIGAGARRDRFSTIDERGRRCLREPAHGLRAWPRAIARRGRAFTGP